VATVPRIDDFRSVATRLALSSGVWGVILVLVGIASVIAQDPGVVDATQGKAHLLQIASGLITVAVGALFVVAGQRLKVASTGDDGAAWHSALLMLAVAIQAQIFVALPAIGTSILLAIQSR
jgi:hypothetical protein